MPLPGPTADHDVTSRPETACVWAIVSRPGVLSALERIAHQRRTGWQGLSWGTGDLTHEALIRMSGQRNLPAADDRAEFEKAFSATIQRVLADKYRRKHAKKREGGWARVAAERLLGVARPGGEGDADLAGVVEEYVRTRPLHCVVVWMTAEFGLTADRIAAILDIKPESVERKLRLARAELRDEIDPHAGP